MSGDGPAVVLCDGLACDGFIWPYLIDYLVGDYTIVRFHYAAHGESDTPEDPSTLSVERFARDLEGILAELDLDDVVLVGHSLGVQVIFEYYGRTPERVRSLVAICGNYKRPLDTFHDTDALRRALPYLRSAVDSAPSLAQTFWSRIADSTFSRVVATVAETNPSLIRTRDVEPYLEHVADLEVEIFLQLLENVADHSAEAILPQISRPTIVIAGERDTFTPVYVSREMAELIEGSELLVVPDGTHVAPLEVPTTVNRAVESFLAEH